MNNDFDSTDLPFETMKPLRPSHYLKKALGQHFLRDREFAEKIASALPKVEQVVEIGPGDGALTQEIINRGHSVLAIEIDADLIPKLKKRFHRQRDRLTVIPADVLEVNWPALAAQHGRLVLAGNLPYNIATPMLFNVFAAVRMTDPTAIVSAVFTLQLEVAERLTASPGNKSYGALSLLTRYHCNPELLFSIPADRFFPKPKVAGGVVRLNFDRKPRFPDVSYVQFRKVVRGCFAQRRKVMRNSIRVVNDLPNGWEDLPFDWGKRPEQFTFEEFVELAIQLKRLEPVGANSGK